jgi:hypothetical protein
MLHGMYVKIMFKLYSVHNVTEQQRYVFHIHAGCGVLDIPTRIPIHVWIELHCKYGEATWGSKITKTLKLDFINNQHLQRDSELCRQTCVDSWLQISGSRSLECTQKPMSPVTTSCFFNTPRMYSCRAFRTMTFMDTNGWSRASSCAIWFFDGPN